MASNHNANPGISRPLSGIGLMLLAMTALPIMDGIAKYLGYLLPIFMPVWARFFFQTCLALPLVVHQHGAKAIFAHRPLAQALRSVLLVSASFCFFTALHYLPMAETVSLFFISPILVTALSPLVLDEKYDPRRWLAVIGGFLGVLIIVRPGFAEINAGTFFGLTSGLLFACFVLLTRRMRHVPVLLTTLYNALYGAILLTLLAPFFWAWPTPLQWLLMLSMGLISVSAQFTMVAAYQRAEASLLAPFAYTEIIAGSIVGFIWFGDIPDHFTYVGAAILMASGMLLSWSETRKALRKLKV